jgi:hypothetical protein
MVEMEREGLHKAEDPKHIAGELVCIMDVNSGYGKFMFGGMSLINVHGIRQYLG